jgi:hypothetical protein
MLDIIGLLLVVFATYQLIDDISDDVASESEDIILLCCGIVIMIISSL